MDLLRRKLSQSPYLFCSGSYVLPEMEQRITLSGYGEGEPFPAEWELLKKSGSVISFYDKERNAFVKIYRKNGLWRTLKRRWAFPRSYRCLAGALRLAELQIPTPEVWYASRYELVTAFLPRSAQFLNVSAVPMEVLMDLVVRLHHGGFVHGDLNYRNIFRTAEGQFGLIDLDAVTLYSGTVPALLRMKELGRLISSGLQFTHVHSWKRIRERTGGLCELYEKKSQLSCDRKYVEKIVCSHLTKIFKKYKINCDE